jgi:hypothetical protein
MGEGVEEGEIKGLTIVCPQDSAKGIAFAAFGEMVRRIRQLFENNCRFNNKGKYFNNIVFDKKYSYIYGRYNY